MFVVLLVILASVTASEDLYSKADNVVNLSPQNFPLKGNVWMVEFYAPWCGHCQRLTPEWKKAATALKGVVNFGAVNCDAENNKQLCGQFGVKGFPTIKAFVAGQAPVDYAGAREAKDLQDYAANLVPSASKRVTSKNADAFFKSKLPKVLLFTDKPSTPLLYKSLSSEFKSFLVFGEVQKASKELVTRFDITVFPSLLVLAAADDSGASPTRYDGVFQAKAIRSFLASFLPEGSGYVQDELPELKDHSCFVKHCESSGNLCVIGITPAYSSDSRKNKVYLDILTQVSDSRSDSLFAFSWANGSSAAIQAWASGLEVEPSDAPQVLVLVPKKQRSVVHVGAFSFAAIKDFVAGVLSGSQRTFPLRGALTNLDNSTSLCAASEKKQKKEQTRESKERSSGGSSGSSAVDFNVVLTDKNFDEVVMNSPQPWLVEFFAPWCGHCQQLAPEWSRAASKLRGVVKFGSVDCTVETQLASRFSVQGYPTIKVFGLSKPGQKKSKVTDYASGRTATDLARFADTLIPNSEIVRFGSIEEAQQFLSAPFRLRLFLFNSKDVTSNVFRMLAHMFSDRLLVVEVNRKFESLWETFHAPKGATTMYVQHAETSVTPYQGPSDFLAMVSWIRKTAGIEKTNDATVSKPSVPLTLTHVKTQDEIFKHCFDKFGLCVLTWLTNDDLLDASGPNGANRYLFALEKLATIASGVNLVYLNANEQANFIQQFGGNREAVGLVALSYRKSRYVQYIGHGPFEAESIKEFIGGVLNGKVKTAPLSKLPPLVDQNSATLQEEPKVKVGSCESSSEDSTVCSKKDEL